MQIEFKQPELGKFIDDEVRAGHYPSPDALIEAAVMQLMLDQSPTELTAEDIATIAESDAEFERGEYVDFHTFFDEMTKKYAPK